MKKTFLATRNAVLSSAKVSWGTGALALVLVALLLRLLAPNTFWYAFTPVFRTTDALAGKSHAFLSSFGDTATLALQNEKLIDENSALANENKALLQKVENLSGLAPNTRGIIAGVVARPPVSPYDTLVLAAGRDEGVVLGQEAFGEGGVPLGVVSSVTAHFSRITLFSASGVTTSGWIGQAHTALTIVGAGGGAMNANVPHSSGVAVGDTVFVPGPGMLPIGTIVRVESNPSSPSVTLRIKPLLNPYSITWVLLRDMGTSLLTP